ncbi:MAG: hypothetical protein KatS3mg111_2020 [Pirellulaceae bacterium]|nr:MAG: hypothetical protein KatS3mg111_2020 [Pirellulaceae bacterium]
MLALRATSACDSHTEPGIPPDIKRGFARFRRASLVPPVARAATAGVQALIDCEGRRKPFGGNEQVMTKLSEYVMTAKAAEILGVADVEDDDEPFEEKMQRLTAELYECLSESESLAAQIKANLEGLGSGG